jgi:hypothetical protein
MIKRWSIFNESSDYTKPDSKFIRSKVSDKLMEIREVFMDFEDMGIVSYSVVFSGYENGRYSSFNPKRGDFESFLDNITSTLSLGLTKDEDLGGPGLDDKYKAIGRKTAKVSDKNICIIADIQLPGEENEFGSTVIGNDGIKLFDDILTANSRLIDINYDVKMDLNSNHHQYKPVKFLIYFNL